MVKGDHIEVARYLLDHDAQVYSVTFTHFFFFSSGDGILSP